MFIGGPKVTALEERCAEYLRMPHAVGCSNGSDAIILALDALGGDLLLEGVEHVVHGEAEEIIDDSVADLRAYSLKPLYRAQKFPALAPLIVFHELGTPLATAAFTRHEKGGFYGVETTPRRLMSDALAAKTPVPGLFLTGQDVMTPGIAGALAGGMIGAAAVDPRVYRHFSW